NGRGKRAQKTPGRTSIVSPGFGGSGLGKTSVSGVARLSILFFLSLPRIGSIERQEARRAGGLQLAAGAAPIDAARRIVRMGRGLGESEDRGEAGVAPLEERAPVRAWAAQEQRA